MPSTLQCARKHAVPFTEDDRGGEVYCPVCGVACPVPAEEVADAPGTLRCRNGHAVPYSDDDRGGEVYCRSCGVACEVPAAESTGPGRRAASVFSSAGEVKAAANVAGRMPCPRCEQPVSYTVAEYGETVYCSKCGASVLVGESLQQSVAARAEPAATGTTPVREHRRRRTLLLLGSFGFVLALVVGFIVVTSTFPESMPFDAAALPWNKSAVAGSGEVVIDPSLAPKEVPKPKPRPDEKIKPEMIERLLKRDDVAVALDDAERWKDVLVTHRIPDSDARIAALKKAIPELKKKMEALRPAAASTSPAEKCLDVLDRMLEAIERKSVAEGRRLGKDAEVMLKADADLQKRYSERLDKQSAMLDELARKPQPETPTKTVADVEKHLALAMEFAQANKVTEAMEERARAMFLGPRVLITPPQKQRLTLTVKELTTMILKARGKRSVADAEKCLATSDGAALKVLVAEALKDLPEFTKEPEYRVAYKKAEDLAKKVVTKPLVTDFGKSVVFRHEYEQSLDYFREGDKLVLAVEAAEKAHGLASDDAAKKRVIDLTAEGIEVWILTTGDGEKDADRRVASVAALEKAKPWIGESAWKKLSAQIPAGSE